MSSTPPSATTTRIRDLSPAFWWLWFAELVTWIGRFVVPFMTIYLTRDAGLTSAQAGLVIAGYGLGVVGSALGGGVLIDALGRRTTLVASLLLSAVTLLVVPIFEAPAVIAGLLFVYGLVNGAAQPAVTTLITDLVPAEHRRAAFSYNYWAINLGYAIGPIIAGVLADQAFELLFYGQAVVLVIAAVIVSARVPETHGPRRTAPGPGVAAPTASGGLMTVLRDRVFMMFVLAMSLYSVVYVQSTTTLPLVMVEQGFSTQQYGMLLTLNGLLLCALQIPSARFLGRWSREKVLVVALCVTAVGMGTQAFAVSLAVYAGAVAIWTLGEMGSHPSAQSIAADMSPRALRGRYQGTYALTFSVATVVAPVGGGAVLDHLGSTALWFLCGAACLVAATFLGLTARAREERIDALALAEAFDARDESADDPVWSSAPSSHEPGAGPPVDLRLPPRPHPQPSSVSHE